MQPKHVLSKTYENQILTVTLQNYAKINFKRLYKNLKKTYKDFISTSLKIFKNHYGFEFWILFTFTSLNCKTY